ncbi:MAG: ATP-binding protein [Phycisphaerae bacterium]|nr:ATP-binding protein [Phycisphaerae bacterium]
MNIEKIAAKLKPLMPEKVNHWLRARELADPEMKVLIEKQIVATAYQKLGDFHNNPLLSLPPEKKAKGPINIGTILYDTEKYDFGINETEFLQNMGIFGRSGSGKTNLAFHIIKQLDSRKIPYLFFDNKRTLRHLIPALRNKVNVYTPGRTLSNFSFNPFITPSGLEPPVYINQLIDVLANAFTLGDGSKSILQKAIFACYNKNNNSPLIEDIIEEVEKIQSTERVRSWKISALRALETLSFSNIITNKVSQKELTKKLTEENTIIELDGLGDNARKFLIPIIYQWIFQLKLCSPIREKLTIAIFIDEAHLILNDQHRSGSLVERLLRQTRELGIATVIMDQTPSLMSKVVLANCYTNIFLNLVSTSDLNKAANVCLLANEEKNYFSTLPVGQGIIKLQDRWPKPFLVKFPLMNINKGSVTDEILKRYSRGISTKPTHLPRKTFLTPEFDVFRQIYFDVTLKKPALQLIFDILTHPHDNVTTRYYRLNLNPKIAHKIKEDLISQGWLEAQTIEQGQTRKQLLRLTKQAKKTLNLHNTPPTYGSLEHEYWKHYYANKFKNKDYQITLEHPRKSGNTDIVAIKENEKIAIEIETGKSDYMQNLKQNLDAKYDKILIIATNEKAYQQIQHHLADQGLLIPSRIVLNGANSPK